jgi:hypothetical protein
MNNSGDPTKYKLVNMTPLPWKNINRKSVVAAMLMLITDNSYSRQAPYIIRSI